MLINSGCLESRLSRAWYVARNRSNAIISGHRQVWERNHHTSKLYLSVQSTIAGRQGFTVLVPRPSNENMVPSWAC